MRQADFRPQTGVSPQSGWERGQQIRESAEIRITECRYSLKHAWFLSKVASLLILTTPRRVCSSARDCGWNHGKETVSEQLPCPALRRPGTSGRRGWSRRGLLWRLAAIAFISGVTVFCGRIWGTAWVFGAAAVFGTGAKECHRCLGECGGLRLFCCLSGLQRVCLRRNQCGC